MDELWVFGQVQAFLVATGGAYTIYQALWEVPLVQVFWVIVAYAQSQGVEGIMSPTEIKHRIAVGESAEFMAREAKFMASRKRGR